MWKQLLHLHFSSLAWGAKFLQYFPRYKIAFDLHKGRVGEFQWFPFALPIIKSLLWVKDSCADSPSHNTQFHIGQKAKNAAVFSLEQCMIDQSQDFIHCLNSLSCVLKLGHNSEFSIQGLPSLQSHSQITHKRLENFFFSESTFILNK